MPNTIFQMAINFFRRSTIWRKKRRKHILTAYTVVHVNVNTEETNCWSRKIRAPNAVGEPTIAIAACELGLRLESSSQRGDINEKRIPLPAVSVTQAKISVQSSSSRRPWHCRRYTVRIEAVKIANPNSDPMTPFISISKSRWLVYVKSPWTHSHRFCR